MKPDAVIKPAPSESRIQAEIRLALSEHGICFRTNAGEFYQGKPVYSKEFNQRVLINLRPVHGLPIGFPDLLFIRNDGTVFFIETKTESGRLRTEQINFIDRMDQLGIVAGVARSVEDAIKLIGRKTNG
jgi:hypothetical protein